MKILADKTLISYRQSVCNSCEHLDKKFNRCKICGCFMWAKTRVVSMTCPLNKWNDPTTTWGARFKIQEEST
jgi:hypothetical protein